MTDVDRLTALENRWKPTSKTDFPVSYHSKLGKVQARSISLDHLKKFPWLAISNTPDYKGAWCVYCVLFHTTEEGGGKKGVGQKLGKLVNCALTEYAKLTGKDGALERHSKNNYHQTNKTRAVEFISRATVGDDVMSQVNEQYKDEVLRNRGALGSIVEILKFCGIQDLPLRGHRDSGRIDPSGTYPKENDGNFRMLIRFRVNSGDSLLQSHLRDSSTTSLYTSPQAQNELLSIMCDMLKRSVVERVKASHAWALMVDETTDRSNREQMVLVVRYSEEKDGQYVIKEDPISLVDVFKEMKNELECDESRMTGENLAKLIISRVRSLNLDFSKLVAQSYDGAASMASQKVGVSAHVKNLAPMAFYFHCTVHALNLATSQVMKVEIIRNALGTMESIIVFVCDGAKRQSLLTDVQEKSGRDKKRLIKISETRFVERHLAVERFCDEISSIYTALTQMTRWVDRKTSSNATNLIYAIQRSDFVIGLVIMKRIAAILRPLSQQLQAKGADLVEALQLIDTVKEVLSKERDCFPELLTEAEEIAEKLDFDLSVPRIVARSRCRSNAGGGNNISSYYRVNAFNPCIDAVQQDLKERFDKHQKTAFGLTLLLPKNCVQVVSTDDAEKKDSVLSALREVYDLYKPLLPDSTFLDFEAECKVWSTRWKNDRYQQPVTAIASLNACDAISFPTIHRLLQVLAILPVSTAEAERFFSKVGRTMSALRSTMTEDRLEALVLLQAHREELPSTSKVIDLFNAGNKRRMSLANK